jgi:hypothetical protein
MRTLAAVLVVMAFGACSDQINTQPQVQTFDVDTSGTATCPTNIYDSASNGLARCSRPPETCYSQPGASLIQCVCTAGDGGTGVWTCAPAQARSDGGTG